MTNVFNFLPRGAKSGTTDFLREADDTLKFDETARSVASLDLFQKTKVSGPAFVDRDWSNQELADLYRVKRMLDAAGVSIDVDRGLTDEGDPWFLFLNAQGEVFIHLCRLDQLYILDSPNVAEPLRGYNFNDLIDEFSNRTLAHTGQPAASHHRVVRLERNGKVFLHPSALLAALIWTLFIAAEELVLIMPEEDDGLNAADLEALFVSAQGGHEDLGEASAEFTEDSTQDSSDVNTQQLASVAGDDLYQRELGSKLVLNLAQNNYALGLSTIAIALGFVTDNTYTEADSTMLSGLFAAATDQEAVDNLNETHMADAPDAAGQSDVDQIQTVELTTAPSEAEATALVVDPNLVAVVNALHAAEATRAGAIVLAHTALDLPMQEEARFEDAAEVPQAAKAEPTDPATVQVSTDQVSLGASIFTELRGTFSNEIFEFTFGQIVVQSTLDLSQTDLVDISGALTDDPIPTLTSSISTHTVQYGAFDDEVRAFVDFVLSKTSNLEIISTGQEVLIIDSAILDTPGATTYALSWSLGTDNGVVSMIGLRSEFEAFDLIA